jgi:hypothetical protein
VTPDMEMGVQLTSGGPGGGTVIVNHPNGKPGVILGCGGSIGLVMVKDTGGKILDSIPKPKDEADKYTRCASWFSRKAVTKVAISACWRPRRSVSCARGRSVV